ncbi:WecB/TagA/CpsF family glycosyltransferase [uncultured Microscilla sp.]|uniref:WecB/TagA/CpsF family glycosyltransferase n=1 Tax=uncultured Microscilla sp. TaxID=432653 RepID=UPI002604450A|nr:WecB/TagA/CpsF family glycosyltransferase [uncultured Microscilla sp.]
MQARTTNKTQRVHFLSTPVDCLTLRETIDKIEHAIDNHQQIHRTDVNAGKIVMMHEDKELHNSVVNADIINADGQSVVWASKILKKPVPERVTGIDLMEELMVTANKKSYSVFFFGATEEIVSKVVQIYTKKYGERILAGFRNGYFSKDEEESIAQQIAQSNADLLFVGMGSPQKENFLYKYRKTFSNVSFVMGVGGSFDVIAGKVKRAPKWMQKAGLEWFYRLIQEPKRLWKRYAVGNYKFIKLVLAEKFSRKK